jgi:DNA-directed RNA polymerase subunit F
MDEITRLKIWRLIDKLDSIADWTDAEYKNKFGKSRGEAAKEIKKELRELLKIPAGV